MIVSSILWEAMHSEDLHGVLIASHDEILFLS
jgi:hypothetical protein